MFYKNLRLFIVLTVIASFGLAAILVNTPTATAAGNFPSTCAEINAWAARLPMEINPTTQDDTVFMVESETGAVITAAGTNLKFQIFNRPYTSFGPPYNAIEGSGFSYTIQPEDVWVMFENGDNGPTGTLTSLNCSYPEEEQEPGGPVFDDGRLDVFGAAAPAAVYPAVDGGLTIYTIGENSSGVFGLYVSAEMIADSPESPAENTLIASNEDGTIAVYRLTTGEIQYNIAPDYVLTCASSLDPNTCYHP